MPCQLRNHAATEADLFLPSAMHPHSTISMSPRLKGRSLLELNAESLFNAVAICNDEPSSTQNCSAALDTTKAMKQNVLRPLSNDSRDGLLPQLEAYALPSGVLQCLGPCAHLHCAGAASLWCRPGDNEYERHFVHWNNRSNLAGRAPCTFISLSHIDTTTVTYTPSSSLITPKLQAACKLPSSKAAISVGLQTRQPSTLCYGSETVIVASGDFIQLRPRTSVIVCILDVLLPGLRPLPHSKVRHGRG